MRIAHIALWADDIERLAQFYAKYFGATIGAKYTNELRRFESRFLTFADGARLELMHSGMLRPVGHERGAERMGLTHLAIAVGSEQRVDALTRQLRQDGVEILTGPRRTGDGYYESVALDPDGNRVELVAEAADS